MSTVSTKKFLLSLAISASASLMVSCGGSDEQRQAESLFIMAETAAQNGDYQQAMSLLDSLDSTYPKQIEHRKKGAHLRATTLEKATIASIERNERQIAEAKLRNDSLSQFIVKVDNPIEPYFVAKSMAGKSIVGKTGIEARMMPDGALYLISSLSGPKANHESVSVSVGGETASTSVIAHDGERNDRSMGYEVIHYMPAECNALAAFIAKHRSEEIELTFNGKSQRPKIKLDQQSRDAVATLYEAAATVTEQRRLQLENTKLERQLQMSRDHAANTFQSDKEAQ